MMRMLGNSLAFVLNSASFCGLWHARGHRFKSVILHFLEQEALRRVRRRAFLLWGIGFRRRVGSSTRRFPGSGVSRRIPPQATVAEGFATVQTPVMPVRRFRLDYDSGPLTAPSLRPTDRAAILPQVRDRITCSTSASCSCVLTPIASTMSSLQAATTLCP